MDIRLYCNNKIFEKNRIIQDQIRCQTKLWDAIGYYYKTETPFEKSKTGIKYHGKSKNPFCKTIGYYWCNVMIT